MQAPQPVVSHADAKYAADKITHNESIIYRRYPKIQITYRTHSRVFVALVFGIMTGVFGFTNWNGILFYLVASIFTSILLLTTFPNVRIFEIQFTK